MAGLTLAAGGWIANLIVYLIQEFNIKSISAAKIYNVVNGSITMFPIIGAIVADSFVGCFSVIWFSSLISLLGTLLLVLTAAISHLRPPSCEDGSNACRYPSHLQFAVLYLGLALASLGNAGTRFTIAPMGADQFNNPKSQGIFFNWYIFTMYTATVISSTAIVYVEDNVGWAWGFGLCAVANVLGLAVFLSGSRSTALLSQKGARLGDWLTFLNRAALRSTEEDTNQDGSITNPWKQCTVQQVEDLKSLIKIFPLWSTGLFLCTPLAIQLSLATLQALNMDRRLGPRFHIPAGSMSVFILISTSFSIFLIDRLLFPLWEKLTRRLPKLLQRIGIGHALTIISMAVSAVVESKRLKIARSDDLQNETNAVVPMSALWLVPQLAIAGIGEAFHFPGQVALYYQEFPESLKSTSTAAVAMFIGIAFYISNAIIDLIRRATGWLPDDINKGGWIMCTGFVAS
ncbi:UNVERIFIED_CONTAM: protein NRT1/ PTR FAMILY 2.6 [Sesamum radiatum]|uniref:Protein NRT1/ PTR FAMILY 2.6 n=1 Tax=Sesamum radiatum TaxID=300843 RepID=A0AAW2W4Y7_SESRA